jgi:two-component system, OmpR family, response regulator PhoP
MHCCALRTDADFGFQRMKGSKVMRILVVEDDSTLRCGLQHQLAEAGFNVDVAVDGAEGLYVGLNFPLDVAIVDVGLPRQSGLDVIREWRARARAFPVMVLTARNSWADRVAGLSAGADDYMGKPFSFEEIHARLRALIRRFKGWASSELVCGPFQLNTNLRTLCVDGEAVDLSTFEYRLLESLMMNAGKALSGIELAEEMYQDQTERESNIVAQLIFRLRKKLDPLDRFRPIETVYGHGYRFAVPRGPATPEALNSPRPKSRS